MPTYYAPGDSLSGTISGLVVTRNGIYSGAFTRWTISPWADEGSPGAGTYSDAPGSSPGPWTVTLTGPAFADGYDPGDAGYAITVPDVPVGDYQLSLSCAAAFDETLNGGGAVWSGGGPVMRVRASSGGSPPPPPPDPDCNADGSVPLRVILTAVALRAGLTAPQVDFSLCTQRVFGFKVDSQRAAKDIFDELLTQYATDLTEVGGRLVGVPRGGAPAFTLAWDDLGAHAESGHSGEPQARLVPQRAQDAELPRSLDLTYPTPVKGFDPMTASVVRPTKTGTAARGTASTAVVYDENTARGTAERLLETQWSERDTYQTSVLPRLGLRLAPADVLLLTLRDGATRRVRVTQEDLGLWGPAQLQAVRDDPALLTQNVRGATLAAASWSLHDPLTTRLTVFNGTALSDADALGAGVRVGAGTYPDSAFGAAGLYLAASGDAGWAGATVSVSLDGGLTWVAVGSPGTPAAVGVTSTALGAGTVGTALPDPEGVTVTLSAGALSPHTLLEALDGANLALLTSGPAAGEWVRFTGATRLSSGAGTSASYRLTGLLRGQRGLPASAHASGATFALMSGPGVLRAVLPDEFLGRAVLVRAVPTGGTASSVTPISVTLAGNEYKPYSPASLAAARSGGAGSDLVISFLRRTRIGGEMTDGADVPLSEASEHYDCEVRNGSGTLVRTFAGLTSPTVTYTAAQQVSDSVASGSPVTVTVYQIGRTYTGNASGRGYPATATF